MHYNGLLPGICLFMLPAALAQDATQQNSAETQPSAELLEFLADFGAIDNQTYELIEYHALQDRKSEQEKTDEN